MSVYATRNQKTLGLAFEARGLDALAPSPEDGAMHDVHYEYM